MVDFSKRLGKKKFEKKTEPIELYDSLDRSSVAGPLRPAQEEILEAWYSNRKDERDLIIKLHTGEGKTLIGLLILQSKLNSGEGPCLYICPNKYLVNQVCRDAKKFGVKYCKIEEDGSLPNEFLDSEKILVTHVQKVFNGKSIFGVGNKYIESGCVLLDDSHACIDSIRDSFTIKVDSDNDLYNEIFNLFSDDIEEQGQGTFLEIKEKAYESFLPIPYWAWIDKNTEVLEILSKYINKEDAVKFTWPIIKDNLKNCQAFISGKFLEISPIHIPIEKFSTFSKAKQRILMSATTQDDSFFIKGLGFSKKSVLSPLTNPKQIWSGEKMLIIPSLIDDSLDRDKIVNELAPPFKRKFGIVSLIPSFNYETQYTKLGAFVPKTHQIDGIVDHLKKGNYDTTIAFSNRYDGIDLPDATCRILILDGKPFFFSLADRYEESIRINSDFINIKIAQKIEQGLGRSVRGEKDYSLIIITGGDLVRFMKSSNTNKYFSPQTKKQIEIGIDIANLAKEDLKKGVDPYEVVKSLVRQSLSRDENWKAFYQEEMNMVKTEDKSNEMYEILALERKASEFAYQGNNEKACEILQSLIDTHCNEDSEKGWYLQMLARYKYFDSKVEANRLQKSAFQSNRELLLPKEGINYKKLDYINENRISEIKKWVGLSKDYEELALKIDGILSDLQFGIGSDKFEAALKELGTILGFSSQRPDKEYKKGPDNLWCGVDNQYLFFECKSEVERNRAEISKQEVSQMNTHSGWFEGEYGKEAKAKRFLIIPTKNVSYHASFTHDVEIIRANRLKKLRENIKSFFKEFKNYNINELSDEKIQEFLNAHQLDLKSIMTEYSEKYNQRKN